MSRSRRHSNQSILASRRSHRLENPLELTLDVHVWPDRALALSPVRVEPVDAGLALRSVFLPGDLHADPADRMIVATAMALAQPLVTRDARLQAYPAVETVW